MDTDAAHNKISIESPLGKQIFGKKQDDRVQVSSPQGDYEVRIIEVIE